MGKGRFAQDVDVHAWGGLVPGHGRGLVVEDDIGDVLAVFDGVGDGDHAGVEKGRIPHKDELFVVDKGVDTGPGAAAQAHAGKIVHQLGKRLVFEHGIAADVAVEDQIYGVLALGRRSQVGRGSLEDASRVAVRAPRAEGGRTRRNGCGGGHGCQSVELSL